MNFKIPSLLVAFFGLGLLGACSSFAPAPSTKVTSKTFQNSRRPTSFSELNFSCSVDGPAELQVNFIIGQEDNPSFVSLAKVESLWKDTVLKNQQKYEVDVRIESQQKKKMSLVGDYTPSSPEANRFYAQVMADDSTGVKSGSFSIRDSYGNNHSAVLVCCAKDQQPQQDDSTKAWSCVASQPR